MLRTGGQYDSGLLEGAPGLPGISRSDVAAFIVEGVGNTLRGLHHICLNCDDNIM